MRSRTTTSVTAGTALALGLLLGACSPAAEEAAPAATETAQPTEAASEEPAPEPAPTEAAKGTRENPAQPDVDTITFSEAGAPVYEVLLSKANFAADDVVAQHYEFNEPAPEGSAYAVLPVTATYRGAETGQAWLDLDVTFVAADGRTFEPSLALVPDDLTITPEVGAGGVVQGNLSFALPADALAGGLWSVVHEYGTSQEPSFFAAA
ncbi:hypothetical protein [Cellulomonas cellasea]|uniref:DUF4352 domain-containing protein n=1 Tax=Cellulomonas cellasea TaxID=43670 RepID=A0A7W4YCR3_9CELL|nr:hypothetical protein [Cellulomonas cellasea]MBB2925285.1 hypothetical protein [Cellulomonas cellasea]